MFATFVTVALFAASAIHGAAAATPHISTPSASVQCKPVKVSWAKTKGPYNIIVVPASDPCGSVLQDLGDVDASSLQWTPKIAKGTKVQLSIEDADGEEAWSNVFTVGEGEQACLPEELKSAPTAASTPSASASSEASAPTGASGATESAPAAPTNGLAGPGNVENTPDDTLSTDDLVGAAGSDPFSANRNSASGVAVSAPVLALTAVFGAFMLL